MEIQKKLDLNLPVIPDPSRVAALKELFAIKKKPFPLWALLAIYEQAHAKDVAINHMEGFKLLAHWLAPIEVPTEFTPLPKLYNNWDMQSIAAIFGTAPGFVNTAYQEVIERKHNAHT
jgi:hypothetical protein